MVARAFPAARVVRRPHYCCCTRRAVGRVRALLLAAAASACATCRRSRYRRSGVLWTTDDRACMDIRGGRDRRPGDRRPSRGSRAPRRPQISSDEPQHQQRVVVGASETTSNTTEGAVTAGPYRPPVRLPAPLQTYDRTPRLHTTHDRSMRLPAPLQTQQDRTPPRLPAPPPQTHQERTPRFPSPPQDQPQPLLPTTPPPQEQPPRLPRLQTAPEESVREAGDGVEDCGERAAPGGSCAVDETELLAKLRCPSESAEVVAEREKRRQRRRCPDYPGLALSSSVFSTETGMKFSIIRNELHNVLKPQLRRVSRRRRQRCTARLTLFVA